MADEAQIAALRHELGHYERYGMDDRAAQVREQIKAVGGKSPAAKEGSTAKRRTATKTRRTADK